MTERITSEHAYALSRWLEIRHKEQPDALVRAMETPRQIGHDIQHSSLIQRLLAGKEPLPQPPPTAFASPWYGLVDQGFAIVHERHGLGPTEWAEAGKLVGSPDHPILVVNQSLWLIDERYVHNHAPAWRVHYPKGDWQAKVEYVGHRQMGMTLTKRFVSAALASGSWRELSLEEFPGTRSLPLWSPCYEVRLVIE